MTHDLDTEERYRPDPALLEMQQMLALLQNVVPSVAPALLRQQSMYDNALAHQYWCQPVPWWARWWSPW